MYLSKLEPKSPDGASLPIEKASAHCVDGDSFSNFFGIYWPIRLKKGNDAKESTCML